jgi:6-phosphogluconolactonase
LALLTVAEDEHSLAELVAARIVAIAGEASRVRSVPLCLTGGSTPKRLYQLLATGSWRDRIAWDRVELYWSDERHVPPDHPDSNYGMTRDALLRHVPIPAPHVHRIHGEASPEEAVRLYERELPPAFDLMLLGLGEDTHIASIFPGSPVLNERRARVAAVWASHLDAYRITLTPAALLGAAHIVMLVAGAAKAPAVAAALDAATDLARHPVHLLREADDRVEWFIDRAAARDVSSRHA